MVEATDAARGQVVARIAESPPRPEFGAHGWFEELFEHHQVPLARRQRVRHRADPDFPQSDRPRGEIARLLGEPADGRVKNDERDAADLADLLRMGRLPEAWIAPPATRELRELVRHRAKLVALRSSLKCQVHAVLAACGVQVPMSDLFGAGGQGLLERVELAPAFRARVNSATA